MSQWPHLQNWYTDHLHSEQLAKAYFNFNLYCWFELSYKSTLQFQGCKGTLQEINKKNTELNPELGLGLGLGIRFRD